LAPLLCIPLYLETTNPIQFYAWFVAMAAAVISRYFLLKFIQSKDNTQRDFIFLNTAIGTVTFVWGMG